MALEGWPSGLPAPRGSIPPDSQAPERNLVLLGALAMHLTVFLILISHGHPPRESLVVTAALAISGATAARRLLDGDDNDGGRGGPRWAH